MRFASLAIALGFMASGLASDSAFAATSTASFSVTATVLSSCQATAPVAAFGSYATAGRSALSVTCTHPTPYNVSLNAGTATDDTPEISNPVNILLNNTLLSNSAHTLARARRAGTASLAGLGNLSSHAQLFNGQTAQTLPVSSGAFADAITVTISY